MKFLLAFSLLFTNLLYGQKTIKEAEKLINDKLKVYGNTVDGNKQVSIDNNGLVTIKIKYADNTTQEWLFELSSIDITLDFYKSDGQPTNDNVVLFSCKEPDCIKFNYYKKSQLNNNKMENEYGLSVSNNTQTKNIYSYFLKAKALVKGHKNSR